MNFFYLLLATIFSFHLHFMVMKVVVVMMRMMEVVVMVVTWRTMMRQLTRRFA